MLSTPPSFDDTRKFISIDQELIFPEYRNGDDKTEEDLSQMNDSKRTEEIKNDEIVLMDKIEQLEGLNVEFEGEISFQTLEKQNFSTPQSLTDPSLNYRFFSPEKSNPYLAFLSSFPNNCINLPCINPWLDFFNIISFFFIMFLGFGLIH
jgi:hypothetical protein